MVDQALPGPTPDWLTGTQGELDGQTSPQGQIWLIGGTSESAELAQALVAAGIATLVSVTSDSARSLYPVAASLTLWVGRLGPETLADFIHQQRITAIVDASHPFAVEISQGAIAAAQDLGLPYLRWERAEVSASLTDDSSRGDLSHSDSRHGDRVNASIYDVDSIATLVAPLLGEQLLAGRRVLLTLGYRALAQFSPWQQRATLFARILPSPVALESALAAGFSHDRLIALRPPIGAELETALWRQWQIERVVTKASGHPGGEAIKRQVAAALHPELGVELVVIARPQLVYPRVCDDLAGAIAFCRELGDEVTQT